MNVNKKDGTKRYTELAIETQIKLSKYVKKKILTKSIISIKKILRYLEKITMKKNNLILIVLFIYFMNFTFT